jgi:hypothetical protein
LSQAGYQDQFSQHNVNLVRAAPTRPDLTNVPFTIGNPDNVPHHITFQLQVYGIDPYWKPVIGGPNPGDPAPDIIPGDGSVRMATLQLVPAVAGQSPLAPPANYQFGDQSQVEVTVLLDGQPTGGVTVQLVQPSLYLPLLQK